MHALIRKGHKFLPAKIANLLLVEFRLQQYGREYLKSKGWQKSCVAREPIDDSGPTPLITYPARMFLERVVDPTSRVFEFGSGNSSLWWSQRVAEVVSVEHDAVWSDRIARVAPENLTITARAAGHEWSDGSGLLHAFSQLPRSLHNLPTEFARYHGLVTEGFEAYVLEITKYRHGHFNIVVIDGMARAAAAFVAAKYIDENGFIVFDNADRPQYNDAFTLLHAAGFRRIDFYGSGPTLAIEWCTSIFARNFAWLERNQVIPGTYMSDIDH